VRRRLRELGYTVGRLPPGPRCSLVDVPGVRVGHRTLNEGDSVRTGVTAVLPHGGNVYAELGTTWFLMLRRPREAAHVLGKLLVALGPERIVWGTDSAWYGSPPAPMRPSS